MEVNTICFIVWFIGALLSIYPAYFEANELEPDKYPHEHTIDRLLIIILICLSSWVYVIFYLIYLWDMKNYYKWLNTPRISELKTYEQKVNEWKLIHLYNLNSEEAHNKSIQYMKELYGDEWWRRGPYVSSEEQYQLDKLKQNFERTLAEYKSKHSLSFKCI